MQCCCGPGQDFKRVGLSTLTDILNVVAPPISEHEVIQVWLSHDMQGYDGIESLVYRALSRVSPSPVQTHARIDAHPARLDHGTSRRWRPCCEPRRRISSEGYHGRRERAQCSRRLHRSSETRTGVWYQFLIYRAVVVKPSNRPTSKN